MSDRRRTVPHARVIPAVQPEDTDENEPARPPSVQRVMTPSDVALRDVIDELLESADAAVPPQFRHALVGIRDRVAEDRAYFERRIAERIARATPPPPPSSSKIVAAVKGIGVAGLISGLIFAANALMARGASDAANRQQTALVERLGRQVEALTERLAAETLALRAKDAGHDALLQVLAARLAQSQTP